MGFTEMKIRNSAGTVTGLVVILIMVMAIFIGGYLYLVDNVESAGLSLDSKYQAAYGNITAAQEDLDTNVNEIRDSLKAINEAETTFQVAWNGLKGLGKTIKLPITFINTALATWTAIVFPTDIIPGWAKTLAFIAITAFVVFLVIKVLKGEPNM